MTDRQLTNLKNANSGMKAWSCPFEGCDFEATTAQRWRHILDAHE